MKKIIKTKTGFKEILAWNKLYKYQTDGVLGTIDNDYLTVKCGIFKYFNFTIA